MSFDSNRTDYSNDVHQLREANPEQFDLWLETLESGIYNQGSHQLYDQFHNSFCCMGVYCDLMMPKGLEWVLVEEGYTEYVPYRYDASFGGQRWTGDHENDDLSTAFGFTQELTLKLSKMNDSQLFDFPQIAAWLREQLAAYKPE